jgi:hypothetical protein
MQNLDHTGATLVEVISSTSNISNITISGDIGDIGDRITLPTPAETLGMG